MFHGLSLSTSASMGIHLKRGRHVRMTELRLSYSQRRFLLMEQRPMRVP